MKTKVYPSCLTPSSTNLSPYLSCGDVNMVLYMNCLYIYSHIFPYQYTYIPLPLCSAFQHRAVSLFATLTSLPFFLMATLFYQFLLFSICIPSSMAYGPPSPGYYPSSKMNTLQFDQGFRNLWGPQHQRTDQDSLTIWLDHTSGSGFKSWHSYRSGYFGAAVKLQPGYTAGVITSFYLSNSQDHPGNHDEIDIEFLGTTPDRPYTLQTNVYIRGSGDGRIIGREMRFHLWFDPTQDFHNYAIIWNPTEIIFLVDDVPIRRYPKKSDATFPERPMYAYGSIWDASPWATEDGKYKADYRFQPFVGKYRNFRLSGCTEYAPASCHSPSASPSIFGGLTHQQYDAMAWAQRNYLVYDYCHDQRRDHTLTPEC